MSYPGSNSNSHHYQNQPPQQSQQQYQQQHFQPNAPMPYNTGPPSQYQPQMQQQQQQQYHPQMQNTASAQYAQQHPQVMQLSQNFQYSSCRGAKKALLVGVNYTGQKSALAGCQNDVRNMRQHLQQRWAFTDRDQQGQMAMICLTDDQHDPNYQPTRQNILNAIGWLVGGARPGDSLFFHFSGHGGQVKNKDNTEQSGYDQCIYPVDHTRHGPILDNELHSRMVKHLPRGVRLTVIMDCCHSGSIMDLPYIYDSDGSLKQFNGFKNARPHLERAGKTLLKSGFSVTGMIRAAVDLSQNLSMSTQQHNRQLEQELNTSQADVVMLSGCKDGQTSADTHVSGVGATGAMSYAFIHAVNQLHSNGHNQQHYSYLGLLNAIRQILVSKYSQKPQLSSGYPMDMNMNFLM